MDATTSKNVRESPVLVPAANLILEGDLGLPEDCRGIVLFAHGSGSGRHSPRNRFVASWLREAGLGTLLIDLLTSEEERLDRETHHLRFDIDLLARRLVGITDWLAANQRTRSLTVGYFGASTGAGAALVAATQRPDRVDALVSRGGRADLAGDALSRVQAPTLLIVGAKDLPILSLNEEALAWLGAAMQRLVIVPGATHLFEEPGTLEEVARLAADWFTRYLEPSARATAD